MHLIIARLKPAGRPPNHELCEELRIYFNVSVMNSSAFEFDRSKWELASETEKCKYMPTAGLEQLGLMTKPVLVFLCWFVEIQA